MRTLTASLTRTSGGRMPVDSTETRGKQKIEMKHKQTREFDSECISESNHLLWSGDQTESERVDLQMKWSRTLLIFTVFFRSSCRRTSLLQVSRRLLTTLATFLPTTDDTRYKRRPETWDPWGASSGNSVTLNSTINVLELNDSSWEAALQSLSLLSFHGLQEGDLREESVTGCGHWGELGVIFTWTQSSRTCLFLWALLTSWCSLKTDLTDSFHTVHDDVQLLSRP